MNVTAWEVRFPFDLYQNFYQKSRLRLKSLKKPMIFSLSSLLQFESVLKVKKLTNERVLHSGFLLG